MGNFAHNTGEGSMSFIMKRVVETPFGKFQLGTLDVEIAREIFHLKSFHQKQKVHR